MGQANSRRQFRVAREASEANYNVGRNRSNSSSNSNSAQKPRRSGKVGDFHAALRNKSRLAFHEQVALEILDAAEERGEDPVRAHNYAALTYHHLKKELKETPYSEAPDGYNASKQIFLDNVNIGRISQNSFVTAKNMSGLAFREAEGENLRLNKARLDFYRAGMEPVGAINSVGKRINSTISSIGNGSSRNQDQDQDADEADLVAEKECDSPIGDCLDEQPSAPVTPPSRPVVFDEEDPKYSSCLGINKVSQKRKLERCLDDANERYLACEAIDYKTYHYEYNICMKVLDMKSGERIDIEEFLSDHQKNGECFTLPQSNEVRTCDGRVFVDEARVDLGQRGGSDTAPSRSLRPVSRPSRTNNN